MANDPEARQRVRAFLDLADRRSSTSNRPVRQAIPDDVDDANDGNVIDGESIDLDQFDDAAAQEEAIGADQLDTDDASIAMVDLI